MSVPATALVAISVLAALSAVFLLARRLTGALLAPLPLGFLVFVAAIAAAITIATTSLSRRSTSGAHRATARGIIAVSLPLFAIALSLPQSPMLGLILLWMATVGAEIELWRHGGDTRESATRLRAIPFRRTTRAADHAADGGSPLITSRGATQQLIYRQADNGAMTVEGLLHIDFAAGERTVNAHVAFCPAFLAPPQVDVELSGGPDCAVRQALAVPWGVRWELKLTQPASEPASVILEFLATEKLKAATAERDK